MFRDLDADREMVFELVDVSDDDNPVEIILDDNSDVATIFVSPSGIIRSAPIRVKGRAGDLQVNLQ